MTLNCCVYNDKMFQKDTMISANAYRCEILVCEEKVGHEWSGDDDKDVSRGRAWGWRSCPSTQCLARASRCQAAV